MATAHHSTYGKDHERLMKAHEIYLSHSEHVIIYLHTDILNNAEVFYIEYANGDKKSSSEAQILNRYIGFEDGGTWTEVDSIPGDAEFLGVCQEPS